MYPYGVRSKGSCRQRTGVLRGVEMRMHGCRVVCIRSSGRLNERECELRDGGSGVVGERRTAVIELCRAARREV